MLLLQTTNDKTTLAVEYRLSFQRPYIISANIHVSLSSTAVVCRIYENI